MEEVDKSKAEVCCATLSNAIPRLKLCSAPSARPLCKNRVSNNMSRRPMETMVRRRLYQEVDKEIWNGKSGLSKPTTVPSWSCKTAVTWRSGDQDQSCACAVIVC